MHLNKNNNGMTIRSVAPFSIGSELNLEPGDHLVSINGQELEDIIDYQFQVADEEIELVVRKPNNMEMICEIEKDFDEDLGISFENITSDGIRQCHNRCLFCFVDQMPNSLRHSLYVKDDDYRYSFYQGTFVTLTNLDEKDLNRIIRMRLSPLYVSVHTTNPELRRKMLKNKNAGQIMKQLKLLAEKGIEVHAQIVLCPNINDGQELERSINELRGLWPGVQSLAIVPVGLTRFRDGLADIKQFTKKTSSDIIKKVSRLQQIFLREVGTRFVYLADEFYLLAEKSIPETKEYEDYPQLENGVGIVRSFMEEYQDSLVDFVSPVHISERHLVITGQGAVPVLGKIIDEINQKIVGPPLHVVAVKNEFFGPKVTVAGLLSGIDIIKAIKTSLQVQNYDKVLIPDIIFNDEGLAIDNISLADFSEEFPGKVVVVPTEGSSILDYLRT